MERISKNQLYISQNNVDQTLFSPRIILCSSLPFQMGHVLPLTIRSVNQFYGVDESMRTKIHLSSMQFFIDNHKSITDAYQELITEKQINYSFLPVLAIAKSLSHLKLLEENELDTIKTFLREIDESMKFHSSPEDDIIYCLWELFSDEGNYDYDDEIPLEEILIYIKHNSDFGNSLNTQTLSRILRKHGLIGLKPTRKRVANYSNKPNAPERVMRNCYKINKTVLNNKMKELQNETPV